MDKIGITGIAVLVGIAQRQHAMVFRVPLPAWATAPEAHQWCEARAVAQRRLNNWRTLYVQATGGVDSPLGEYPVVRQRGQWR